MKQFKCVYIEFISNKEREIKSELCSALNRKSAYKLFENKLKEAGKDFILIHVQEEFNYSSVSTNEPITVMEG